MVQHQDLAASPEDGAELVELTCWLCRRTFMGVRPRANRICDRPRCQKTRDAINRVIRTMREADAAEARCRFCPDAPVPGSKFCARHQFIREPCPGCGGKVRRNEGQGNQKRFCSKRCKRPRRGERSERAFEQVAA